MAGFGVDGCKGGWIHVRLDGTNAAWGITRSLHEILSVSSEGDVILVDVPIGLHEGGADERLCDLEARRALGPVGRAGSVFPVPCRAAVYADSYDDASHINEERTGRRISKQVWGIVPRIREADELLRTSAVARARMREAHPEVLFWAFAEGRGPSHPKKTPEGLVERVALLDRAYPGAEELAAAVFVEHGGYRVGRDDVVDAFAAAVTALLAPPLATLPEDPPLDAHGIPMQMVHAPLSRAGRS